MLLDVQLLDAVDVVDDDVVEADAGADAVVVDDTCVRIADDNDLVGGNVKDEEAEMMKRSQICIA